MRQRKAMDLMRFAFYKITTVGSVFYVKCKEEGSEDEECIKSLFQRIDRNSVA
jgi:hypothetical protein